jgi:hypothetical protein
MEPPSQNSRQYSYPGGEPDSCSGGTEVFRGLTVAGPGITIQGLSLYGFWSSARVTLTTPPADIFIASAPPPADASPDTPLSGPVQPRRSNPGYCQQ